jgi:hypothetical protein
MFSGFVVASSVGAGAYLLAHGYGILGIALLVFAALVLFGHLASDGIRRWK